MAQKVKRMPFFFLPIFQGKIAALMPIFCQKIVQSPKNTVLSCHLLQIFIKNPRVMPIFSQKSVGAVKTGLKKSIGSPSFNDFH